mmetsp:Transcript_56732/g.120690  ORF Transcript_56732/g.120690 Transcript_56732/m.120690 type:complete len:225 (-) Transcript_56732:452-1126(-)
MAGVVQGPEKAFSICNGHYAAIRIHACCRFKLHSIEAKHVRGCCGLQVTSMNPPCPQSGLGQPSAFCQLASVLPARAGSDRLKRPGTGPRRCPRLSGLSGPGSLAVFAICYLRGDSTRHADAWSVLCDSPMNKKHLFARIPRSEDGVLGKVAALEKGVMADLTQRSVVEALVLVKEAMPDEEGRSCLVVQVHEHLLRQNMKQLHLALALERLDGGRLDKFLDSH